jgi:hypothetical protein
MKTQSNKRSYCAPDIALIKLDKEISLILMSGGDDPGEPGMSEGYSTDNQRKEPFFIG